MEDETMKLAVLKPLFPEHAVKGMLSLLTSAKTDHEVEDALEVANTEMGGYGVEAVRAEGAWIPFWLDCVLQYVNMGDTYDTTLLYDTHKGKFMVGSMGDWVESTKYKTI
jgi:hypothetical protein